MKDLNLIIENEPCLMCAMALVHSRIKRVYFINENLIDGAFNKEVGVEIYNLKSLNH